jgi:hypothetical protein
MSSLPYLPFFPFDTNFWNDHERLGMANSTMCLLFSTMPYFTLGLVSEGRKGGRGDWMWGRESREWRWSGMITCDAAVDLELSYNTLGF